MRTFLSSPSVAALGASTLTIASVMSLNTPQIHTPSVAQVAPAAFDSPLAQVFDTLNMASNYLVNSTSAPTSAANWPYANFGTTFGVPPANFPLLPAALNDDALGAYLSVGVVSQFIDDALPIISQLGYNGLSYLTTTGNALFQSGSQLAQSTWTAVGQALTGNFAGALATLTTAISDAGSALLSAGTYVFQSVAARASAVVSTLAGVLPQLLTATAAQAAVLASSATKVITNTITALSLGNIQAAWNAAVDGLLGPSGIPGTLLNLTIGAGVQTGPVTAPDSAGIAAVFVPSVRTEVQTLVRAIATDLQTPPPAAAAKTAARSTASVRSVGSEKPREHRTAAGRTAAKRSAAN